MKKDINKINDININKEAIKIAFIYIVVGFMWIIFSEKILAILNFDDTSYIKIQIYKGWLFVISTSVMIYILIYRSIRKVKAMNKIIDKSLTELSATQAMLLKEKVLTDNVIKDSTLIVYTWDLEGKIMSLNQNGEEVTGYKEEEIIGKFWPEIFGDEKDKNKIDEMLKQLVLGNTLKNNIGDIWKTKDGRDIEFLWTDSPMYDDTGQVSHVISFGTDITGQKEMLTKLNYLAYFDSLTGLPNRTKLKMEFTNFIDDAVKNNTKIGFLYIDLDNFKQVNDTLGHDSGDELLIHLAEILIEEKRDKDYLAKLSEDEYAFILNDIVDQNHISEITEKILEKIRQPWCMDNNEFLMSASVGISIFPDNGKDFTDLMKYANMGMYNVKSKGKNGYEFYDDEMGKRIANNTFLINQIKRAIDEEQFLLQYQPVINLVTDKLMGAEALLRWYHPERGYIPPMDYIPLIEETGQIFEVTSMVLRMAIRQKSLWNKKGYGYFKISINVSSKSLVKGNIVDEIKVLLKEYNVNPDELVVEITETAFMDNLDTCIDTMMRLDEFGVGISLDDFGTGYSSLAQLKNLPIKSVKMDQEFTKTMERHSEEEVVVKSIIDLAHTLGLNIVAEGIETKEQKDILIESGCDFGQGYYLARPMNPEDFEEKFLYNI